MSRHWLKEMSGRPQGNGSPVSLQDHSLTVNQVLLKRLRHVVSIDIDGIRAETPSLCQAQSPSATPKKRIFGHSRSGDSNATEKPLKESPPQAFLDWTGVDPSQSMTEFGQLHWQPASTQPFMYATDTAYSIEHPLNYFNNSYDPDHLQAAYNSSSIGSRGSTSDIGGSSSHLSSAGGMGGQPVSSLDASATLQIPEQPQLSHHSSSETMEIPYAESFAWPFQNPASSDHYGSDHQDQPPSTGAQDYGHMQLTSDDIAAFMRINPASDPFQ